MLFVFWNESAYGRGVVYLEPNRPLAGLEFSICFVGLLVQGFMLVALTLFSEKSPKRTHTELEDIESEGFEMPQPPERLYQ